MNPRSLATATLVAVAGLATTTMAKPVSILDVAPSDSIVVAVADNAGDIWGSFQKTGLMDVWKSAEVQNWVGPAMDEYMAELADSLDEMGLNFDELPTPNGPAGFSLVLNPNAGEGEAPFNFVTLASFTGAEEQLTTTFQAIIDNRMDEEPDSIETVEYDGITIYTYTESAEDFDEDMDDFEEFGDFGGFEGPDFDMVSHLAMIDDMIVNASSMETMELIIDMSKGAEGPGDSIRDDAAFNAQRSMLGASQAYAVVKITPFTALAAQNDAAMADDEFSMMPPIAPILDAAGLDEVKSVGIGITANADSGVMESTFAVMVPQLEGLMKLVPTKPTSFTPPAFVSADATSFSTFQVDFAQLLPAIQKIAQGLPPEMGAQVQMGLGQASFIAGPILSNLGPQINIVQTIRKPYSADSQTQLIAIETRDAQTLEAVLTQMGQQFMGLEPRDFNGNPIWDMSDLLGAVMAQMPMGGGGGGDLVMAIGANRLMFGPTAAVEDAMRLADDADAPRLADDARFKAAQAAFPKSGLAYSWTNARAAYDYARWSAANMEDILRQQLIAQFGDDPDFREFIDDQVAFQMESIPPFMTDMPALNSLWEVVGDSYSFFEVTDKGIVAKSILLRAN